MRVIAAILLGGILQAAAAASPGELVIIVNPESGVDALTRDEVINIFMGRYRKLPSGVTALPVDEGSEKAAFYHSLVDKELAEIQSYWARLVFSGQGSPPRPAENAEDVMDIVANNKGAVGYIDRSRADPRVRIVLDLAR